MQWDSLLGLCTPPWTFCQHWWLTAYTENSSPSLATAHRLFPRHFQFLCIPMETVTFFLILSSCDIRQKSTQLFHIMGVYGLNQINSKETVAGNSQTAYLKGKCTRNSLTVQPAFMNCFLVSKGWGLVVGQAASGECGFLDLNADTEHTVKPCEGARWLGTRDLQMIETKREKVEPFPASVF